MKTPPKREVKKQAKVVEHTLTANKNQEKTAELKPHQKPVANFLRENDISIILSKCSSPVIFLYGNGF